MVEVKEKVGRADWERLKIGETGVFTLPNEDAVAAARVAVSHLRSKKGLKFERINVGDPLSIAYRRLG